MLCSLRVFLTNLQSHWSRTALAVCAAADFQWTKMEPVTTDGISRMWFGIFCFVGPLLCYLEVQQRTWGCHFAWNQQKHCADSVRAGRSQVERVFSSGMGACNKTALERQKNTGRQPELIFTFTSSPCRLWHKRGDVFKKTVFGLSKQWNLNLVKIPTYLLALSVQPFLHNLHS